MRGFLTHLWNRPAVAGSVALISGICLAKHVGFPTFLPFLLSGFFLLVSILTFRRESLFALSLVLSVFFAGALVFTVWQFLPADHISRLAREEKKVVLLEGRVASDPIETLTFYKEPKRQFLFKTELLREGSFGRRVSGAVRATLFGHTEKINYGDILRMRGELYLPREPGNPGGFNYKEYLARKNIFALFTVKRSNLVELLGKGAVNPLIEFASTLKKRLKQLIVGYMDKPASSLLLAMLLGERQDISEELNDRFVTTGTVHILAISGLHVGLLALIILGLFKVLRIPRRSAYLLTALFLIFYCILTGCRTPVARATIMGVVYLLGLILNRDVEIYTSLAAAALIILIWNPSQLFDPGFQLSFATVLSIVYFTPKAESSFQYLLPEHRTPNTEHRSRKIARFITNAKRYLLRAFAVSLCAWLGALPLVAYYFNIVSPVTLIANLAIVPLAFLSVAGGFIFLSVGIFSTALASIFAGSAQFFLSILIAVVSKFSEFPYSHARVQSPIFLYIAGYYILLLLFFNYRRTGLSLKRAAIIILLICNFFVWREAAAGIKRDLLVTFLDVGRGDCAFVEFPGGGNMLIDGGRGLGADDGRWVISPFLWKKGINRIDAVILTHPDTDHFGGLPTTLRNFKTRKVFDNGMDSRSYLYGVYKEAIHKKGLTPAVLKEGDEISGIDGVRLLIFHPPRPFLPALHGHSNNNSIVLKLEYKSASFLFCGDIEEEGLRKLFHYKDSLAADIIKVPHHGANLAEEGKLLCDLVRPKIAVISSGRSGRFGHPAPETVKVLEDIGAEVYQTGISGAITIRTDGNEYAVETVR